MDNIQDSLDCLSPDALIQAEQHLKTLIAQRKRQSLTDTMIQITKLLDTLDTPTLVDLQQQLPALIAQRLQLRNSVESPLLRLLPEIRLRILEFLLVDPKRVKIDLSTWIPPKILCVSSQLREEGARLHFAHNAFSLPSAIPIETPLIDGERRKVGWTARLQLRHLKLIRDVYLSPSRTSLRGRDGLMGAPHNVHVNPQTLHDPWYMGTFPALPGGGGSAVPTVTPRLGVTESMKLCKYVEARFGFEKGAVWVTEEKTLNNVKKLVWKNRKGQEKEAELGDVGGMESDSDDDM